MCSLKRIVVVRSCGSGKILRGVASVGSCGRCIRALTRVDGRRYDTGADSKAEHLVNHLAAQDIDFSQRNVIVAHQNVTANGKEAERGGSESMVGGIGQVDYSAFDGFEYAALGHIHSAYPAGRAEVRYAGSPLAYHFNETRQPEKGPLLVTLGAKGQQAGIERLDIEPLHRMREIRGEYEAVRAEAVTNP